jgi:sortase B
MDKEKMRKKRFDYSKKDKIIFAALISVLSVVSIIAASNIVKIQREYAEAESEYDTLREYSFIVVESPSDVLDADVLDADVLESEIPEFEAPIDKEVASVQEQAIPNIDEMLEINPDFVGWMFIDGTAIHYPVVQGEDNEKYMRLTFRGVNNPSGTIFMDHRHGDAFDSPLVVIYGHNMRNGSMFHDLRYYLRRSHMVEFPDIVIFTHNGEEICYRIFSASVVDVSDSVFPLIEANQQEVLDYIATTNAPQGTQQILALSTCVFSESNQLEEHVRLLVLAARV